MNQIPAILMPTAPRYVALAKWTCGQISRFWPDHPKIYICGTADADLPLRDDPRDWMCVVRSACADLQSRGVKQVYLILDDHPPISRCNSGFLKTELPQIASELNATSIVTGGFGPLIPAKGKIVNWKNWRVECLPITEPWKLPLHPALWKLDTLWEILDLLLARLPEDQHTPWAFERVGSDQQRSGLPISLLSSCWRLDARQTSTPETLALHDWRDWLSRGTRRLACAAKRAIRFKRFNDPLRHPRIGPYPCFWSGVMKKGVLNRDYITYASKKNRCDLIDGLDEAFSSCGA